VQRKTLLFTAEVVHELGEYRDGSPPFCRDERQALQTHEDWPNATVDSTDPLQNIAGGYSYQFGVEVEGSTGLEVFQIEGVDPLVDLVEVVSFRHVYFSF